DAGEPDVQEISVEWKASGGNVFMGDRTMAVIVEPGMIPDLAEAPAIGLGNGLVEPAIGTRKVLTILHNPHRPAPDDVAPPVADFVNGLFGAESERDYFEVVSGGKFTIENEGVLGWYDAAKDWSHYWSHPGCDDPTSDGYSGGHQERWAEAIG